MNTLCQIFFKDSNFCNFIKKHTVVCLSCVILVWGIYAYFIWKTLFVEDIAIFVIECVIECPERLGLPIIILLVIQVFTIIFGILTYVAIMEYFYSKKNI